MKQFTFLFLFLAQISFAQSDNLDSTIKKIEFGQDSVKAVFDWVANNVRYDVAKLDRIKDGGIEKLYSKFNSQEELEAYFLDKVIKDKKGVCQDYALLFDAIMKKIGYQSFLVEGYIKTKEGKITRGFGHAWNAVKVKGTWRLYDPTWAAGYVKDQKKFVKKYNLAWYDVDADEMIKTHMPFDPVWQISSSPMSYEEFETKDAVAKNNGVYDFENIIQEYLNKSKKDQIQDQVARSKGLGEGPRLINSWRKRMTKKAGLQGITNNKDLLNEANAYTQKAVDLFNTYIKAKNKQFKGKKWSVDSARTMLMNSKKELQMALDIYNGIDVENKRASGSINGAISQSEKLMRRIDREFKYIDRL